MTNNDQSLLNLVVATLDPYIVVLLCAVISVSAVVKAATVIAIMTRPVNTQPTAKMRPNRPIGERSP